MKQQITFNRFFFVFFSIFCSVTAFSQTEVPPVYSPDGTVNALVAKGDTLIVGGNFNHVGKYTGGGALFPTNSDQPILAFPKILGTIISSTPDGNGGFYIYGKFKRETENIGEATLRIEHVLANNTFDTAFSLPVNALWARGKILYHNGILYFGGEVVRQIAGQPCGDLAAINVSTKLLLAWIPTVSRFNFSGVTGIYVNNNILYIIGNFREVGGVQRNSAAAIEIGTGVIKNWNPTPNWDNFYSYADLVFYGDKIIMGGNFGENSLPQRHSCAIVDNNTGQTFEYIFNSNFQSFAGYSYLHFQSSVTALAIANDVLFAFSQKGSTGDNRVTAINLLPGSGRNSTIWTRHFNANVADGFGVSNTCMAVSNSSLFVLGSDFKYIQKQSYLIQSDTIEYFFKGGVKLNVSNGFLENWFPEPIGWNVNDVSTVSVSGGSVFIGGKFSHVNGIDRVGVYMVNAQTDAILPLTMAVTGYPSSSVNSLKLINDTLYVGGDIRTSSSQTNSVVAFNINTNTRLGWNPAHLGTAYALDANEQYVFAGGRLTEPSGGSGRTNLFAIDRQTGQLADWSPNPSSEVYSLRLWKGKLYAGGDFRTISGQPRNRLASFDIVSLALSSWAPNVNGTVFVTCPKDNTIWVGGSFSNAGDSVRNMLAGIQPESGSIRTSPYLNGGTVRAIQSKGCAIFNGGNFRIGGAIAWNDLFLFDVFNRTTLPANIFLQDEYDRDGTITSIATVGNDVYFGGDFTKVNGKANATSIGRVRYPASFFEGCGEYVSIQNGNWNNPATWERNAVPPASARVTVRHNVVVTQNASCYSLLVEKTTGRLNVNTGIELKILSNY